MSRKARRRPSWKKRHQYLVALTLRIRRAFLAAAYDDMGVCHCSRCMKARG